MCICAQVEHSGRRKGARARARLACRLLAPGALGAVWPTQRQLVVSGQPATRRRQACCATQPHRCHPEERAAVSVEQRDTSKAIAARVESESTTLEQLDPVGRPSRTQATLGAGGRLECKLAESNWSESSRARLAVARLAGPGIADGFLMKSARQQAPEPAPPRPAGTCWGRAQAIWLLAVLVASLATGEFAGGSELVFDNQALSELDQSIQSACKAMPSPSQVNLV